MSRRMTAGTDETQPLLASVTDEGYQVYTEPDTAPFTPLQDDAPAANAESIVVDFDPAGDPDNPLEWPAHFKWAVVSMLACMAFTVPVMNACNTLFIVATVLAATSQSVPQFVLARMLNGLAVARVEEVEDAVLRPGRVLFGSGVLVAISLFSSVAFTFFYVYSTTFADILIDIYGQSPVAVGCCFIVFSVGSAISVVLCNRTLDRIYIRMRHTHKGVGKPEFRLPLAIIGSVILPVAVAAYGWAAQLRLPLIVLLFAVCAMGTALMLAMIPVMAYVVDAFGLYSASAMTGIIVTRCLMSTFLPLTTAPLIEKFGHGWGFTILAGFSLLFAPIPVLMLRYGEHWRKFSKYSRDA
ncbi:hypothetical protein N0V88_007661 [Collariella sp. IMI 366227]|nr:hypothetical protein N0V88_007661 [Collariella sp. IMI 366227]